jgi:hypothetical protein
MLTHCQLSSAVSAITGHGRCDFEGDHPIVRAMLSLSSAMTVIVIGADKLSTGNSDAEHVSAD